MAALPFIDFKQVLLSILRCYFSPLGVTAARVIKYAAVFLFLRFSCHFGDQLSENLLNPSLPYSHKNCRNIILE